MDSAKPLETPDGGGSGERVWDEAAVAAAAAVPIGAPDPPGDFLGRLDAPGSLEGAVALEPVATAPAAVLRFLLGGGPDDDAAAAATAVVEDEVAAVEVALEDKPVDASSLWLLAPPFVDGCCWEAAFSAAAFPLRALLLLEVCDATAEVVWDADCDDLPFGGSSACLSADGS